MSADGWFTVRVAIVLFLLVVMLLGVIKMTMSTEIELEHIRAMSFRACVATLKGPVNDPSVCAAVYRRGD